MCGIVLELTRWAKAALRSCLELRNSLNSFQLCEHFSFSGKALFAENQLAENYLAIFGLW